MAESDPRQRRDPSSMSRARRYTPRGRTVREAASDAGEDNRAREHGARDREAARRARSREAQQRETEDLAARRRREAAARSRQRRQREPAPEAPRARQEAPARRPAPRRPGTPSPRRPSREAAPKVRQIRELPRVGSPARRLRFASALVLILLLVSGGRLVQLQVTDSAAYAADALNQRLVTEPIPAERGSILDRNGNALAYSVEANYIAVDPTRVEADPAELAADLGPLLGRRASELEPLIATRETPQGEPVQFAYLQRGVDLATGDEIAEIDDPGIIIGDDERRIVPGHDLAANVIGFTGGDSGEGLAGLESSYDDWLRGTDGEVAYERGGSGQPIPGAFYREEPASPGKDVQLTLDADLQFQVQKILEETVDDNDAEFGSAMVMEVGSGEMLAMASTPTYDAADPFEVDDEEVYRDYATQETFDPGSIHKAIIFAAALEEGCIEADGTMPMGQTINKGGQIYEDTYPHGDASLSLAGMIAQSSNVGTILLADCLGEDKVYEYQQAFGLGRPTGVGVTGEASGLLVDPELWSGTSFGSIPIGHEITATLIQMAAVYGAIANDGEYVQPTLIDDLIDAEGDVVEDDGEPETHRVVSEKTAADLHYLLQAPIADGTGTGQNAHLENYRLAGKTGTGKLVKDGEYAPGSVASFVGFAPAEDPQYVVAVTVYVPNGGGGGGTTGDAFRQINEFALGYFGVRPSQGPDPEFDVWG
ncbi:penicillin-binding protein 2 [Glycomyces sp. L485]|uniref:peptidoglycan D,D-transpeptidase FtsI family protein n=1 Tax=Glycomyces sp. L485 TaxID=2909235 RepID=UPI001F4B86AC|nr:penicillin-binding protein 2 [Glycomyces sp. L485]MCH7230089.1 penicillin-binding protein 2 [Glycomyces sp. L485]